MSLLDILAKAREGAKPVYVSGTMRIPMEDVTQRLLREAAEMRPIPTDPAARAVVAAAASGSAPRKASNTESTMLAKLPRGGIFLGGWARPLVFVMPKMLRRSIGGAGGRVKISPSASREAAAVVRLMQRGYVRAFSGPTEDLVRAFPFLTPGDRAGSSARSTVLVPTVGSVGWWPSDSLKTVKFESPVILEG